ncbi:MAG: sialic acid TRAP transporter substrate-binding protein SiaP [Rhizobiales bacterium]|nr:sialic acid TRAP transporter substrate-binding protein SiaP [Hyphomicrobiales bacterium]
MSAWTRCLTLSSTVILALVMAGTASAQTKLRWAHVYEVTEPYHSEALWAASEIKKRSNGKFDIEVFPASRLGNENQLNEGLGHGTVDIVYVGISFAAAAYKPLGITGAPFMLRDFDHWKAYRASKLFADLSKGYEDKTRHKIVALTYYGQRHVTANKPIVKPEDMKGMKLRVPPAPLNLMFAKSVGASATPVAFSDVYNALRQGLVDGQENPLPTVMAKKFYEVQSHIVLTGHISESMVTVIGHHVWNRLTPDEQKLFADTMKEAASKATEAIEASERVLTVQLKDLGMTVIEPDREAFRNAALPLHNDASAGAGWTRAQYDELQALK